MIYNSRYSVLRIEILKEAGNSCSLAKIKEYFASSINSKRALGRVKTLECIMCLLEERDLLNCRNVSYLQQVGKLLKSDKIDELVQAYKKLYMAGPEELCNCGLQTDILLESIPLVQPQGNDFSQNNNLVNQDSQLLEAAQNISHRIGYLWPYLARALDIKEAIIDRLGDEYPKDYKQQAFAALCCWIKRERENASVECLDKALNSRRCKMQGLGTYLREPL